MRRQLALAIVALTLAFGCGLEGSGGSGPPQTICTEDDLAGGCSAGNCRVTAPRGTLPAGSTVLLAEKVTPDELSQDAIGKTMCDVTMPADGPLTQPLTLAITEDAPADTAAALFVYKPQGGSALLTTSAADAHGAAGTISDSATYGVTKRPAGWQVAGYAATDVDSTASPAAVLRNLSSRTIDAAYWDGTRLFVGNGARVVIYNGLPKSPSQLPDVVLGQTDLTTSSTTPSSSVFSNGVRGIWSNGTKLAVSTGNRVLVWNTMPSASFTPADVVLGQPDFSTDAANNGGVSASSFWVPSQIDSDGTRLAVADVDNHRVLVWSSFPDALGQPATSVIGQQSFASNALSSGATPIYQAWGVSLAGSGAYVSSFFAYGGLQHVASAVAMNPAAEFSATQVAARVAVDTTYTSGAIARLDGGALALRDSFAGRIGIFRKAPTAPGSRYDVVLGQPDPGRQIASPVNASSSAVASSYGLSATGTRLLVPDANRLLVFDNPTYNYEPASFVIGQAGFTANGQSDYRGIGPTTLAGPADVAMSATKLAVADRSNNRVLVYDRAALATVPATASVVVGQPDMASYVANGDIVSPSASLLSGPAGVALDANHLVVADTENHRVLVWSPVPTTSGAPASVVLGQADFAGRRPNHGRGDTSPLDGFSDADKNGFFYPTGVATDGTHLVVADAMNHRVLVWNTIPTANDAPADAVIGQATFTANLANRGAGAYSAMPNGFNVPRGVAIAGTTLWVADSENNRIVRVSNAFAAPTADAWLGQPDGATVTNWNYNTSGANSGLATTPDTSASSVLRPRGVAVTTGAIYVSEQGSNRVHLFDAAKLTHVGVLGQPDASGANANAGGIGAASLAEPSGLAADASTLFVADAKNHRVVGYDATKSLGSIFVGQTSAVSNGFNQASSASGSISGKPHGLAVLGSQLYVADTAHHRVLVLNTPPAPGDAPLRVYGQPDTNLILPNAGGGPSAHSLYSPRGVQVDGKHVIVADTGNNRVLVYDAKAFNADAALVLGQTHFDVGDPNSGGPSLATMNAPSAAYSDGTRLFVADTGNHRVLVWNTFPAANGQPADLVLGQAAGDQILGNRGAPGAGPNTMSSPTAIDVIGAALYVADSGNNRVLRFAALPTTSGGAADAALGQPDLASRGSTANPQDQAHLAGPVALTDDGANLYVADRDLGRVVVYTLPADHTAATPSAIFGVAGGLSVAGPTGIAVERTAFFTSRVYLSDTNGDRIAVLGSVSRLLSR